MRGTKSVAAGGVAAAAALALAACGPLGSSASGDKDKPVSTVTATAKADSPLSGVAHAVTALDLVKKTATGKHSAKIESTVSVGTAVSIGYKGAIDWSDGMLGDLTMTYSGQAAETMRNAGLSSSMEARYLPDAFYVNMGPGVASHLNGKHWVKYTFDDLASLAGGSGSLLKDSLKDNSPTKSVDTALASPDTKSVGTETVRGVRATHYTGTVDLQQMTGRDIPNLTSEEQSQLRDSLTKSGVTSETIDLWVSQGNLPVKAVVTADTKAGLMKVTTYYSDFGTPLKVQAPPAFDTADVSDLMAQDPAS